MVALCIVLTILTFLTLDYFVERSKAAKRNSVVPERPTHGVAPHGAPASTAREMPDARPAGFFLAPGHVWAELTASGTLWLGLDSLAAGLVSMPDKVVMLQPGAHVVRGARIATICRGPRSLPVTAPFDGVVCEINPVLARDPQLVFADPYGAGRICRLEPDDLEASLQSMRAGTRAHAWMREELGRLRDLLGRGAAQIYSQRLAETLADGGIPIEGLCDQIDCETWTRIAAEIAASPADQRLERGPEQTS